VPLFRREKLHERLAREGGLGETLAPEPVEAVPRWSPTNLHGTPHRPRRWDAVTAVEAADIPGDEISFIALADGSIVTDEEVPQGALEPLADAIEERIDPPYRAEAVRRHDHVWAVAARRIDIAELPGVDGDEIALTVSEEGRRFLVDGAYSFGTVPKLEHIAGARFSSYVAEATRLDGDLWELRITPL
jgi:hypothetical protein